VKRLLVLLATACASHGRETITLWHAYDGAERAALEEVARDFDAAHPDLELRLVAVPSDAFADKITAAIPNGNGPDLFIFAHDRIGDWAEARVLEPIEIFVDDATADRFDTQAIAAMAYRGSLYGLPLAVKSLALFYRTDLVATPPGTTDELLAMGAKLTGGGKFGLVYENGKLYGHAAWLHAFGARIFDDDGKLALDSPETARSIDFARELASIVPAEATGAMIGALFSDGRAAMAMSGPWFVGGLAPGVPWKVAPLPVVSATGAPAAPFLGVEGVMMSSAASDKRAAFAAMDFLSGDASAMARVRRARQVVPNARAYEDPEIGGDPVLAAFRAQAKVAVPMPSSPEMRMVWTPMDTALQKALAGDATPAAAVHAAAVEIQGYIEGRQ
jgi:maltose-binding protein MalE